MLPSIPRTDLNARGAVPLNSAHAEVRSAPRADIPRLLAEVSFEPKKQILQPISLGLLGPVSDVASGEETHAFPVSVFRMHLVNPSSSEIRSVLPPIATVLIVQVCSVAKRSR